MKAVGILGVGSIAEVYVANIARMTNCRVVAVAARDAGRVQEQAARWGVAAETPLGLMQRDDVEVILNLTPPTAHFETTRSALNAGKHVFSEKPLGINYAEAQALADLAESRHLRLGVAPDTVLGAGLQKARAWIEEGRIGRPLMATASIMYHGAESWHPRPAFFYRPGGGPTHDVGPYFLAAMMQLFGPIAQVTARGLRGFDTRTATAAGPELGLTFPVDVLTSVLALVSFWSGVEATLSASWDVWNNTQPALEVHGTTGSLQLPHPAWHGGPLKYAEPGGDWQTVPVDDSPLAKPNWPLGNPLRADYRGVGLAEMIDAIENDTPHRTPANLAAHVVEAADAIIESAQRNAAVSLKLVPERARPFSATDARKLYLDEAW